MPVVGVRTGSTTHDESLYLHTDDGLHSLQLDRSAPLFVEHASYTLNIADGSNGTSSMRSIALALVGVHSAHCRHSQRVGEAHTADHRVTCLLSRAAMGTEVYKLLLFIAAASDIPLVRPVV